MTTFALYCLDPSVSGSDAATRQPTTIPKRGLYHAVSMTQQVISNTFSQQLYDYEIGIFSLELEKRKFPYCLGRDEVLRDLKNRFWNGRPELATDIKKLNVQV